VGTTQECAYLITYLSSEKISSYITGQTYYIDGGQSLGGSLIDFVTQKNKL